MAHFAEINASNKVERVIVVSDDDCLDVDGNESEAVGASFCNQLLGGVWKQTSYNANMRKHYAGAGMEYKEDIDAFISQQPYPSWALDADADWQPPVAYPDDATDENPYRWNEETTSWSVVA
jgi:hypothetical protein